MIGIILSIFLFSALAITLTEQTMISQPFSANERQQILDTHNTHRQNVNPPAKVMSFLIWDAELESIAQKWAENCSGDNIMLPHNPNRSFGYPTYVGENIYATSATTADPVAATNAWNAEKVYYDFDSGTCASGKVCGHYTQEVWSTTTKIGCGRYEYVFFFFYVFFEFLMILH